MININGQEIIECKARWISRYQEDIAFVDNSDSEYLYAIDSLGNKLFSISKEFRTQWPVTNGLFARMDKSGKIGYYNKKGKSVIPHRFEQARDGEDLVSPSFLYGDSARVSYQGQNGYVYINGSFKPDTR